MIIAYSEGVSSEKLAISEIGVSFPDDTFGEESRFGIPFTVSVWFSLLIVFACQLKGFLLVLYSHLLVHLEGYTPV